MSNQVFLATTDPALTMMLSGWPTNLSHVACSYLGNIFIKTLKKLGLRPFESIWLFDVEYNTARRVLYLKRAWCHCPMESDVTWLTIKWHSHCNLTWFDVNIGREDAPAEYTIYSWIMGPQHVISSFLCSSQSFSQVLQPNETILTSSLIPSVDRGKSSFVLVIPKACRCRNCASVGSWNSCHIDMVAPSK